VALLVVAVHNFTFALLGMFLIALNDLRWQVHDAGHMVPMDQPKNSLEMLYRWTRGISLSDKPSNASILEIPSRGDSRTESA